MVGRGARGGGRWTGGAPGVGRHPRSRGGRPRCGTDRAQLGAQLAPRTGAGDAAVPALVGDPAGVRGRRCGGLAAGARRLRSTRHIPVPRTAAAGRSSLRRRPGADRGGGAAAGRRAPGRAHRAGPAAPDDGRPGAARRSERATQGADGTLPRPGRGLPGVGVPAPAVHRCGRAVLRPPGTGKTLAAHVIADELGLDLYQVDLSAHRRQVHRRDREEPGAGVRRPPRRWNVVLFFDEADALFGSGRRSRTRTTATPTRRSPTCCSGWRASTASLCWPPTCAGTSTRRSCGGSRCRRLPVPGRGPPAGIWRLVLPDGAPVAVRRRPLSGPAVQDHGWHHPERGAGRSVPGRRNRR